jgi:hypothetical protein
MFFFKASGVGVLASAGSFLLTAAVAIAYLFVAPTPRPDVSFGWDPISYFKSPLAWSITVGAFIVGFVWEYRRLVRPV